MEGRHLIAEGTYEDLAWVAWARRDQPREGDLLSMVRVIDADGRMLHGHGAGGPPLQPGQLLKVSSDGSEEGPRMLLARAAPSIRRLELTVAGGGTVDVPLYDHPEFPEVRFASLPLARDMILDFITGFDDDGKELERFSLGFQQGQWEGRRVRAGDR
jgi:hypothetical protein